MSLVLHVENFPNLSSVLKEVERLDKWNKVRQLTAKESNTVKINSEERKPRSFTLMQAEPKKLGSYGRRMSAPTENTLRVVEPRVRIRSAPCPRTIDPAILEGDTRLTENAKKLSNDELALLYEDILKPLDLFSILHERRMQSDALYR